MPLVLVLSLPGGFTPIILQGPTFEHLRLPHPDVALRCTLVGVTLSTLDAAKHVKLPCLLPPKPLGMRRQQGSSDGVSVTPSFLYNLEAEVTVAMKGLSHPLRLCAAGQPILHHVWRGVHWKGRPGKCSSRTGGFWALPAWIGYCPYIHARPHHHAWTKCWCFCPG